MTYLKAPSQFALRFSLAVKTSGTSETVIENENISTIENE